MSGGQKGRIGGAITHGHAQGKRSREFRCWLSMRRRCKQSAAYVTRGITVCAEWGRSFEAFLAHIGPAPTRQHTVDRYPNPDGDYEPGNVRWATMLEQRHNRRPDARVGRAWAGKRRQVPRGPDGRFAEKSSAGDYMERR